MPHTNPTSLTRRDALRAFAAVAGGAVLGGLAGCSGGPSTPAAHRAGGVSGPARSGGRVLEVTSFGATGDGRTDDAAAITRALGALHPGDALHFATGRVFCHSTVLAVQTADVRLQGGGTLRATHEQSSAVKIQAPGVGIDGLTLSIANTTQRWGTPDQHKLYLGPFPHITISGVAITGSAAAGIFCDGPSDFRLDHVRVSDTRADGVHMTQGSHHGVVDSPNIVRSGDDGVAVVSYLADSAPCHDITIHSPRVATTTGGRGLSVVGGHDVTYTDIGVADSNAAAVYIACEGGDFVTSDVQRVRVTGGTISGANTNAAIDHGAVLVYSGRSGGSVSDVVVSGLQITATRAGAARQVGVVTDSRQDGASGIVFRDLRLAATPVPYQGDAPRRSFVLDSVTAAGRAVRVTR